ncbi:MAG TPA: bifunctional acetate--CoA ligase family protein/GNAT family N-acetyltransferase [Pelomicrobium sp.]|nr:bifunctional acetate--CoA ligase family protein/GNAT family N-acetyltransferase [Pelomicrobium sp.]
MSIPVERHHLTALFAPRSVAVVGATDRAGSAGRQLMANLVHGGFRGEIFPVNPKHAKVMGRRAYPDVEAIAPAVDLAVVVTPAETVPAIVAACGRKGIRSVLLISGDLGPPDPRSVRLLREALANARAHGVRLLGPDCLGVIRPALGLNATYSGFGAKPGPIALVCQSGALTNAMLDWAATNEVGFSSVITLGEAADIAFGEILDYLAWDVATESILLYLEGVYAPRRFVSALRMAARAKPVIVVKTGREAAAYKAAITHSGALVGADDVFDSVLRRAGAVRVRTFNMLVSAARCLSSRYRPTGNRLAIVTNGGGGGIIAADWAALHEVEVPELAQPTLDRLEGALAANWSRGNPIDLDGRATPAHYRAAISACFEDPNVDGVMVILTPQVETDPTAVAREVVALHEEFRRPLVGCWMGGDAVGEGRRILSQGRIPVFRTPEPAVEAFSHIATHHRNQQLLIQVPYSTSLTDRPDVEGARLLIESALAEKRKVLSETESKALLAAFRIPVTPTMVVRTLPEAVMMAEQIGFPLAMKINSPDVTHKSDVGGVRLNLNSAAEVRAAFNDILATLKAKLPQARVDGVTVQPMTVKPHGRELLVGIATDRVFGPVITFAAGGVNAEVTGDRAVCLPPLNAVLVRDLVGRTRVSRLLGAFRSLPPVDMEALEQVLMRISEMASELPWIRELDINPLIVDQHGAVAVDARVVVDYATAGPGHRYPHMAICPYPAHLAQKWPAADGREITIRAIRPEDAELLQEFVRNLSEESRYFRFISTIQELSLRTVARMTQIDYDREMALIAVVPGENGREIELAAARYVTNPDGTSCEFALVVADDWQGKGIGSRLMNALMDVARDAGLTSMVGDVLSNNANMLRLMAKLGFAIENNPEDPSLKRVHRSL